MGVVRSHWVIDENGVVIEEHIKVTPEDSVKFAIAALG
jgi:peroxiredoxin Q/BCP